jgi:hypothetical protein
MLVPVPRGTTKVKPVIQTLFIELVKNFKFRDLIHGVWCMQHTVSHAT